MWEAVRDWYLPEADDASLDEALMSLRRVVGWPTSAYDGSRRALAGLKNLTSDLIGIFCGAVWSATRAAYGDRPLARHDADLVIPPTIIAQIAVLKGIAAHYVMRTDERVSSMALQRTLLAELYAALPQHPQAMSPMYAADFASADTDAERRRVIVDQIASLTDGSAHALHARLCHE